MFLACHEFLNGWGVHEQEGNMIMSVTDLVKHEFPPHSIEDEIKKLRERVELLEMLGRKREKLFISKILFFDAFTAQKNSTDTIFRPGSTENEVEAFFASKQ